MECLKFSLYFWKRHVTCCYHMPFLWIAIALSSRLASSYGIYVLWTQKSLAKYMYAVNFTWTPECVCRKVEKVHIESQRNNLYRYYLEGWVNTYVFDAYTRENNGRRKRCDVTGNLWHLWRADSLYVVELSYRELHTWSVTLTHEHIILVILRFMLSMTKSCMNSAKFSLSKSRDIVWVNLVKNWKWVHIWLDCTILHCVGLMKFPCEHSFNRIMR